MAPPEGKVTALLHALNDGDGTAREKLFPLVYTELRRLARNYMRKERQDHTLQPTALIHEAYLRLAPDSDIHWQNSAHFVAVAATVMRRVLVDHARSHNAGIHGGRMERAQFDDAALFRKDRSLEVLAVDEALTRLAAVHPRQARVVELRFFAGLSVEEAAKVLGVAPRTVKSDWALARAWLYREIGQASHSTHR
jgi:RNA polymerase sigma-70 factor (ECF subfamily)